VKEASRFRGSLTLGKILFRIGFRVREHFNGGGNRNRSPKRGRARDGEVGIVLEGLTKRKRLLIL